MRILITGAQGQVGLALAQELRTLAQLHLSTRSDLDLSMPGPLGERLSEIKPDLIINAAAYTAVDKAEAESELAFTVNATAVEALGKWAFRKRVPLIHFSTDYVFDGAATEPYTESHPVQPLSVYGKSKAEGERLLLNTGAPCLIIRTAWVYSAAGRNFLKTIIRLASEKDEISVVCDQLGTPTASFQIAEFVRSLISRNPASLPGLFEQSSRMVHFTASGWTSWHGFATAILAGMRRYGATVRASNVRAISSSDYPTAARRPKFSRLCTGRLERVFDFRPSAWECALDHVLGAMFGALQ